MLECYSDMADIIRVACKYAISTVYRKNSKRSILSSMLVYFFNMAEIVWVVSYSDMAEIVRAECYTNMAEE